MMDYFNRSIDLWAKDGQKKMNGLSDMISGVADRKLMSE